MKCKFDVYGMSCEVCVNHIQKNVSKIKGVENCSVSLMTNKMVVSYDEKITNTDMIIDAVHKAGYTAKIESNDKKESRKDFRKKLARFISSLILLIPLMYLSMAVSMGWPYPEKMQNPLVSFLVYCPLSLAIILINNSYFIKGTKALIDRSPTMDTLVALGSLSSFLYSTISYIIAIVLNNKNDAHYVIYLTNNYFDSSAMILTLVTFGKMLEARAKKLTSQNVEKLAQLLPEYAILYKNGEEISVPYEQVKIGDIVVVKTGARVPVDGVIIEGEATIDNSSMTGESIPQYVTVNSKVISSALVQNGWFKLKASSVGSDSSMKKLIDKVQTASVSKSQTKVSRAADKVSRVFVPTVLLISLVTFIIWWVSTKDVSKAINFAVSAMVISCPCALGLATPVAIMASVGKGVTLGIVYKNAVSIEIGSEVSAVVLDKTGTITKGKPEVVFIKTYVGKEQELLNVIFSMEKGLIHPLSTALMNYTEKHGAETYQVDNFVYHPKCGVSGNIKGRTYKIGAKDFVDEEIKGFPIYEREYEEIALRGEIPLLVSCDNRIIGIVGIMDDLNKTSIQAIKELDKMKIKVIMATGDNNLTAITIANKVGIDDVRSQVLPIDKEMIILDYQYGSDAYKVKELSRKLADPKEENKKEIQSELAKIPKKGHVAMVGDGINDSLALVKSDLGVAMGMGSDIAIDVADVILMKSNLLDAVNAIKLAKRTMKVIRINLFWAFFYNIICIPVACGALSSFGFVLNPMLSSLAMCCSSIFVVTTAFTINYFKPVEYKEEENIDLNSDKVKIERKEEDKIMMSEIVKVDGMMCQHCSKRVTDAIMTVPNVKEVQVDLGTKEVTINYVDHLDTEAVKKVVTDAGYTYIG